MGTIVIKQGGGGVQQGRSRRVIHETKQNKRDIQQESGPLERAMTYTREKYPPLPGKQADGTPVDPVEKAEASFKARDAANKRDAVNKDDEGNDFRDSLGPYRGTKQVSLHNNHPVIFDQESAPPMVGPATLLGAFTPDKGIAGTRSSKSYEHGKTRLVIYGDAKTGKPSSWTVLEWLPTGKTNPNTGIEVYDWKQLPNAKAALNKDSFYESYKQFKEKN